MPDPQSQHAQVGHPSKRALRAGKLDIVRTDCANSDAGCALRMLLASAGEAANAQHRKDTESTGWPVDTQLRLQETALCTSCVEGEQFAKYERPRGRSLL